MGDTPNQLQAAGIERAYRRMAEVGYRPAAPSDGMGNVTGELDLEREIERYVAAYDANDQAPHVGCPTGSEYDVFTLITEANRLLCGMAPRELTVAVLKEAIKLLEA